MKSFVAKAVVASVALWALAGPAHGQSLDLGWRGTGLSLGNSPEFRGIRLNVSDDGVRRVEGLNLTLWNPGQNPEALYRGIACGMIGTKARRIEGIAIGGIGVTATEKITGLASGILGVGAGALDGIGLGVVMVDVKGRVRGLSAAGVWTGGEQRVEGVTASIGVAASKSIRGAGLGGVFVLASEELRGVAMSGGGVFAQTLRGIALGGLGVGAEDFEGVALSAGGVGARQLEGLVVGGLGVGAGESITGVALGGLVAFAPRVKGVTFGLLNGLYIDRIDLEDFLHFELASERHEGLSLGLVNYTAELRGVQLGLINYAANNPRWLRLLPFINVHL